MNSDWVMERFSDIFKMIISQVEQLINSWSISLLIHWLNRRGSSHLKYEISDFLTPCFPFWSKYLKSIWWPSSFNVLFIQKSANFSVLGFNPSHSECVIVILRLQLGINRSMFSFSVIIISPFWPFHINICIYIHTCWHFISAAAPLKYGFSVDDFYSFWPE